MAEVKSPLGTRKVSGKEFKSFDVRPPEDEEMNMQMPVEQNYAPQQETNFNNEMDDIKKIEEAQRRRRSIVSGKERLTPGAVDRISALLGITQMTRKVDIGDGILFVLRSLKNNEVREVIKNTNASSKVEMPFEMRRQYLARSIKYISGASFEDFIGSDQLEDKLLFIDELDDGVAARLYNEFVILKDKALEKYSIKTQKEIVEDLKKS